MQWKFQELLNPNPKLYKKPKPSNEPARAMLIPTVSAGALTTCQKPQH